MSHFLTEQQCAQLVDDAVRVDSAGGAGAPIAPRIRRLLEEQRMLREEAGERERMAAGEQTW